MAKYTVIYGRFGIVEYDSFEEEELKKVEAPVVQAETLEGAPAAARNQVRREPNEEIKLIAVLPGAQDVYSQDGEPIHQTNKPDEGAREFVKYLLIYEDQGEVYFERSDSDRSLVLVQNSSEDKVLYQVDLKREMLQCRAGFGPLPKVDGKEMKLGRHASKILSREQ
jgi:hypothetical protein